MYTFCEFQIQGYVRHSQNIDGGHLVSVAVTRELEGQSETSILPVLIGPSTLGHPFDDSEFEEGMLVHVRGDLKMHDTEKTTLSKVGPALHACQFARVPFRKG